MGSSFVFWFLVLANVFLFLVLLYDAYMVEGSSLLQVLNRVYHKIIFYYELQLVKNYHVL